MRSLFVMVLAVTAATAENFCTPGSYFKKDCNMCTCSLDGKAAACTDMLCPQEIKNYIGTKNERFCDPGKMFKLDDRSTCICSNDGSIAECTLGLEGLAKNMASSKQSQYCTPGEMFSPDNCNTCWCSADGSKAMCTLNLCTTDNIPYAKSTPKKVCEPLSSFNDYCNTCFCDTKGQSYACTKMMCDKNIWNKDGSIKDGFQPKEIVRSSSSKQVCEPTKEFKDYCNTCFCSKDGLSFACTKMMCDKEIWNKDGSIKVKAVNQNTQQVCQPRSRFNNFCNTCFCNDEGTSFACTRMMCDKDIWNEDGSMKVIAKSEVVAQEPKQVCQPKSIFKDYCNTCFCSVDGTSFACSRMSCDKTIWNRDGTLKKPASTPRVCEPNSFFMEYCNTCSCSSDGMDKVCTMMSCDKNIWNKDGSKKSEATEKRICEPNTYFKEYCNICACSSDGTNKACTFMDCDKNVWSKDGVKRTEQGKSTFDKVCQPGKAYSPDGCNTCVCNEYGTQLACTSKLCMTTLKQAYGVDETREWGPIYKQGDACTPGKFFYSECNKCVCTGSGDRAYCTLMDCSALA